MIDPIFDKKPVKGMIGVVGHIVAVLLITAVAKGNMDFAVQNV